MKLIISRIKLHSKLTVYKAVVLSVRKPDHRDPVVVVGSCSLDAGLIKDTKDIPEEL